MAKGKKDSALTLHATNPNFNAVLYKDPEVWLEIIPKHFQVWLNPTLLSKIKN